MPPRRDVPPQAPARCAARARPPRRRGRSDAPRPGLILLDLDHFKSINDSFGHQSGDRALEHVATLFKQLVRSTDFAGRIGGEEFLIILPDTALSNSHELAERIRLTTANTTGNTVTPACTVSIGIAQLREGDTLQSLIQRADEALYQAKSNGRNCVAGAC